MGEKQTAYEEKVNYESTKDFVIIIIINYICFGQHPLSYWLRAVIYILYFFKIKTIKIFC